MPPLSIFRAPNTPFPPTSLLSLTPQALLKTWWVTTSTLPMWKSAKNIRITYTAIPSTKNIDDIIHYNPRSGPAGSTTDPEESAKLVTKSIHGVDYPLSENEGDLTYKWRGKGLLFIATSRWQVVGYGGRDVRAVTGEDGVEVLEGVEWVVTYFEKSLFTPAGVDVMTVAREGVDEQVLGEIGEGLKGIGGVLGELWGGIFDIPRD
ncbi:hypothetical protein TWF718_011072 [Orbilia javanica]|uniref:Uncharacterized protein n=1 Tax=Orbilia javanica TaxID=47235 RepID=A0AAN8NNC1_9PEZI